MERKSVADQVKDLIYSLGKCIQDAEKFDSDVAGADAAGTRVRGVMQECKNAAQAIRETVSEVKAARKPGQQ